MNAPPPASSYATTHAAVFACAGTPLVICSFPVLPAPQRDLRLLQAVHADPARRWTRSDLARAVGISPLRLARQVRTSFTMPLRRWLVETRIRAAARDLREDDVAIGEVARRYGYADDFLFSRQFRLVMGTSPRLWRDS